MNELFFLPFLAIFFNCCDAITFHSPFVFLYVSEKSINTNDSFLTFNNEGGEATKKKINGAIFPVALLWMSPFLIYKNPKIIAEASTESRRVKRGNITVLFLL